MSNVAPSSHKVTFHVILENCTDFSVEICVPVPYLQIDDMTFCHVIAIT